MPDSTAGQIRFNGAAAVQPRKSQPSLYHRLSEPVLQWGRGCSAAEMRVYVPSPLSVRLLQWGRGCSAAEMPRDGTGEDAAGRASMGPRLFSRGNSRYRGRKDAAEYASMGPRLFSRGNSTVNIWTTGGRQSFNGAAAVQPRKFPARASRLISASPASMGPRLFSRGNA